MINQIMQKKINQDYFFVFSMRLIITDMKDGNKIKHRPPTRHNRLALRAQRVGPQGDRLTMPAKTPMPSCVRQKKLSLLPWLAC